MHDVTRNFAASIALLTAIACEGPPARLVVGTSDTVIVNGRRPVRIPVRVLDARGHALTDTGVRFQRISGAPIELSTTGMVFCPKAGDAQVRAVLGNVAASVLLVCRPVETVRVPGPIQLMLGDSAQQLPITAFDADGRQVDLLAGTATIADSSVAVLEGMRIRARSAGATVASVRIGDSSAAFGVHVYQRAATLDGLRSAGEQLIALPLALVKGEMRRWLMPPGEYMLAMLPEESETPELRLRIEGAVCHPNQLTKRRFVCLAQAEASVIVYHPSDPKSPPTLTGQLLVRKVSVR